MSEAVQRLRGALEYAFQELGAERLQRARTPGHYAPLEESPRVRLVRSERADELLQQATEERALFADEVHWLRRQLAAARHTLGARDAQRRLERAIGSASLEGGEPLRLGDELARLARADDEVARRTRADQIERALRVPVRNFVVEHADAMAAVESLLTNAAPPERPRASGLILSLSEALSEPAEPEPEEPAWFADARQFLSDTRDAAAEIVRDHARERSHRRPISWHALWHGLRAAELDAPVLAQRRWWRVATVFRELGFEAHMGARMRSETERAAVTPVVELIPLHAPRDVRVAQSPRDLGVLSDVAAADGVGRALCWTLSGLSLPLELRRPVDGGLPEAFGMLAAQLWADRLYLTRLQGLHASAAERVGRVAAAICLLWARLSCGLATASYRGAERPERRLEVLSSVASEALCCDVPPAIAGLLGADLMRCRGRARGAVAGLALHSVLRDMHDEDWFRNPRAGEPLRHAAEQGNRASAEQVGELAPHCAAGATARVLELLHP